MTHSNHSHDPVNNWEQSLKKLRETRHNNPMPSARTQQGNVKSNDKNQLKALRREALKAYLKQWQDENNAAFNHEEQQDDVQVLLQDDWLDAQNILQGDAKEQQIAHQATVWIKRPSIVATQSAATHSSTHSTAHSKDEATSANVPTEWHDVAVNVNVLNPHIVSHRPVLCLSEEELVERLRQRLLPHLSDAVGGMVRTAIQRQANEWSMRLQKALMAEVPNLVGDVVDHNLKVALSEIKYNLRQQTTQKQGEQK